MRFLHAASRVSARFDEPNVVSCAGLVPVLRLAVRCGLPTLVAATVTLGGSAGAFAADKVLALVAGMVAGADSIEDMDLLRHGDGVQCTVQRAIAAAVQPVPRALPATCLQG
jgi:hypothetical protein